MKIRWKKSETPVGRCRTYHPIILVWLQHASTILLVVDCATTVATVQSSNHPRSAKVLLREAVAVDVQDAFQAVGAVELLSDVQVGRSGG